jgi:hypothetical protein
MCSVQLARVTTRGQCFAFYSCMDTVNTKLNI